MVSDTNWARRSICRDLEFEREFQECLFDGATFSIFGAFFALIHQFRSFFEVDFLLFDVFSIPGDGIRASRTLD
jgi:hypothetical protein